MDLFKKFFGRVEPLPAGTHHKQDVQDEKPYRMHLRLHKDGSGLLILNASTVMQLNPTAAEYAYHFIKGSAPEEAARQVAARYRIDRGTALQDFKAFAEQVQALIATPDLDPTLAFGFDRAQPHSTDATLRLDCALTYRLPEGTHAEYAPVKRVDRELTTAEWQVIMDKAWQAGIPHIIFTGGEATLREDLPQLIAYAEKNGQVCGLLTDGLKLANAQYLDLLLQTGLDHVMLILQPAQSLSWKAVETILPQDLFMTVHLTLTAENTAQAPDVLRRLAALGVQNVSLSAAEEGLVEALLQLQNTAQELQLSVRFDLPVPYSAAHPVAIETRDDQVPAGAGRTWLYVEPDGDVLPAQGEAAQVLGNFLRDPWEAIRH